MSERIVDEQFVRTLEDRRRLRRGLEEHYSHLDQLLQKDEKEILRSPRGKPASFLKRFLHRLIRPATAPFRRHQQEIEEAKLTLLREIWAQADERLRLIEEDLPKLYIKAGESMAALRGDLLQAVEERISALERDVADRLMQELRRESGERRKEISSEMKRLGADLVARTDLLLVHLEEQVEALRHDLARHTSQGGERVDSCVSRLETMSDTITALQERIRMLHSERVKGKPVAVNSTEPDEIFSPEEYVAHQDRFRGSPDEIARRQRLYLDYFKASGPVLDVGCGRGEFLELLSAEGTESYGIDINPAMITICAEKNLNTQEDEFLTHLRGLEDDSLGGIFAAQIVEHLDNNQLRAAFSEAQRVLKSDGVLIVETVNPESVFALTRFFYLDADHRAPLPAELLKFIAELVGFKKVEVKWLSEMPEGDQLQPVALEMALPAALERAFRQVNMNIDRLNRFLYGHLEYAVIARK